MPTATSGTVKVVMNRAEIRRLFRSPDKPVIRRTMIFAEKVKRQTILDMRSNFPREFLGPRIVKRPGVDARGGYVDVGAARTKTRPHGIDGRPLLVFYWPKVGRVVAFRHVNHPGSEFAPYLRRKLAEAVLKLRGQF